MNQVNLGDETINLRALDTDAANPTSGQLVGTAVINLRGERFPGDEKWRAPLVSWGSRLFMFATGTFSFGAPVPAEYVEVTTLPVTVTIP
jgi:hypothetical protein